MGKYVIDKNEFQLYYMMLESSDLMVVKEGIQNLSDSFAKGRHVLSSDVKRLLFMLEKLLKDKKYIAIQKWIYKCTCFYSNNKIEKICKKNFRKTEDTDTCNWIISTVASRYCDSETFWATIDEMKGFATSNVHLEILDKKNVFYNASLFGHFETKYNWKNMGSVICRRNDKNGMYWMSKIYAYSELAKQKNLNYIIKDEELDDLTYIDDDEIQTYAYWGKVHHIGGTLSLAKEEKKHNKVSDNSLKWYYAGIIPGEYINCNLEYLEEILKSTCGKLRNNYRAKEGILIGINEIPYNSRFDNLIIEWYYSENDIKFKIKLLEYMIKNVSKNNKNEKQYHGDGSFFVIIQDECSNQNIFEYIKCYIAVHKTLYIKHDGKKNILKFRMEENDMSKNSIENGYFFGTVVMEQKGNIIQGHTVDKNEFIRLLDEFEKVCEQTDLVKQCQEIRNCDSSHIKSKLITFEDQLVNLVTLVSGTPQVIQIAKQLLEYIKKLGI